VNIFVNILSKELFTSQIAIFLTSGNSSIIYSGRVDVLIEI